MNKKPETTHRVISALLLLYIVASPYDLTPPLKWLVPQLSAEWVDLVQLPFLIVAGLLVLRNRQRIRLPLWGAEFLIIIGSLIPMTEALNLAEAVETLLKDFYMYLFFVMLVNVIKDRAIMIRMLNLIQVLGVILAIIMIISGVINIGKPTYRPDQLAAQMGIADSGATLQEQKLIKREVLRAQGVFAAGRQRGTMANADLAGLYVTGAAMLVMGVPFTRRRWLQWTSFAILFLGMIQTGSNGALAAFLAGTGAYLLISTPINYRVMWLGLGGVGLGLLLFLFAVVPPDRLAEELAEMSPILANGIARAPGSVESRTAMLQSGFKQWSKKPIGLSPHGMRETAAERNTHNDYGAYLYERGYLGLAGLLLLLGMSAGRAIYEAMHGDAEYRRLMASLAAVVVVSMVVELVQEFMREREIWMTMAMIVLFAQFEARRRLAEKRQVQAERFPWAVPPLEASPALPAQSGS